MTTRTPEITVAADVDALYRVAAGVFQRIADAHINVRYSYLATGNRLVIAAANPQAVLKALQH